MADSERGSGEIFDVDRIRRLVELMEEHDLREIDLREADQRIKLSRGPEGAPAYFAPPVAAPPPASQQAPSAAAPSTARGSAEEEANIVIIKSPMVGTFYCRPNPTSDPYVKVGDHIDSETTICIIEAMKVFNEIPAETRGRVVAVLLDDEEPVEFGKPLFKIDTSG